MPSVYRALRSIPIPANQLLERKVNRHVWKAKLNYVLKRKLGTGEMAQWSWALAALSEDWDLVLSTHIRQLTTSCNFSSGASGALSHVAPGGNPLSWDENYPLSCVPTLYIPATHQQHHSHPDYWFLPCLCITAIILLSNGPRGRVMMPKRSCARYRT